MRRKILTVLFSLLLLTAVSSKPALAFLPEPFGTVMAAIGTVKDVFKFDEVLIFALINASIYAMAGIDPSQQSANIPSQNSFAFFGGVTQLALANPPNIHTKDYFVNKALADNLLSERVARAATGTDLLQTSSANVLQWWKKFRNLSYAFFITIIVIVGLMVMLRYHTDPRTVVEAVNFIPRIAASLILITFSWVIAGLMVDMAILGNKLLISIFGAPDLVVDFGTMIGVMIASIGVGVGATIIFPLALPASAIPIILLLILLIVGVAVFIMLIIEIIKRWVSLLLLAMFAPLAFLWGTLPGQEDTIGTWFKAALVSALSFPGIGFLVFVAGQFARIFNSGTFASPLPSDLSILGGMSIPFLNYIVAIILLMTATKVPALIEDLLEVKAPPSLARAGLQPGKVLSGLPGIGKLLK